MLLHDRDWEFYWLSWAPRNAQLPLYPWKGQILPHHLLPQVSRDFLLFASPARGLIIWKKGNILFSQYSSPLIHTFQLVLSTSLIQAAKKEECQTGAFQALFTSSEELLWKWRWRCIIFNEKIKSNALWDSSSESVLAFMFKNIFEKTVLKTLLIYFISLVKAEKWVESSLPTGQSLQKTPTITNIRWS